MKLENQVTNLELSKRLKELGVKQNSLYYWFNHRVYSFETLSLDEIGEETPSAFTVAELGEMLPEHVMAKGGDFRRHIEPWYLYFYPSHGHQKGHKVVYKSETKVEMGESVDTTEANARAKLLIYLIENKLLDPQTKP